MFRLTDATGAVIFNNLTASSGLITVPRSGKYTLIVSKTSDRSGSYAFQINQIGTTPLRLGTPFTAQGQRAYLGNIGKLSWPCAMPPVVV